ncbi:transglycosylase domain-containing protein [Paludifilum halophilum]|uniref:Uncharacterized protein n=1 Tax=Paludifilum halophilum TaxID=1642702 RepID=A0A235B5X9_9BACL|nr:transglycosylase domain-containing protein [Paludifilum halophilum]OYD07631.1 hypothetical protein CHM34_09115 [Paludifilum halophilum]
MADQKRPSQSNEQKKGPSDTKDPRNKRSRLVRGLLFTSLVLITLFSVGTMASVGAAAGYVASLVNEEPVRPEAKLEEAITKWSQTSYAYFRDEELIGRMRADADRKVIQADNVSPHLVDALISTEDREFYEHDGIVPRSILRAAFQKVTGSEVQTGGSTITQQLVKQSILKNNAQTMERKAKEIFLAQRMERFFSKEEILNAYLNSVYFGRGASGRNMLGVQAAAQGMFGVDAKDLNLAQSAYIVGMVQRPNAYNPFMGKEALKRGEERMRDVLKNMVENKKISKDEYKKAAKFDIKGSLAEKGETNAYQKYPYITMALEEEAAKILMKEDGLDAKKLSEEGKYRETLNKYRGEVQTGGYRIHTTLDKDLYEAMNKAAQNDALYAGPITYTVNGRTIKNAKEEVGATLLDTKTGAMLGFVGGRDFEANNRNHALDARRQPGSTIKPLLDFGPGMDKGVISPDSVIIDEPLRHSGGVYENYTHRYDGAMTAREALKKSINIPAIKVLRKVGVQRGLDYLRKMNFPVHKNDGEASAIGGFTYGFDVQRVTAGYASLGNEGKFNEPYMIEKITDASGETVYKHESDPVKVYSPQAAYWTTDMLRDVIKSGTGTYVGARVPGYDLAGKTGTTNGTKDVWFMGYTPDITLGVWTGYEYAHRLPNDKRARIVWTKIFQAIDETDPELASKSSKFKSQPSVGFKCFECKRAKKEEEKEKKKKKKEKNQPDQGESPGNGNSGNDDPGNENPGGGNPGDGNSGNDNPESPGEGDPGDDPPGEGDPDNPDDGAEIQPTEPDDD